MDAVTASKIIMDRFEPHIKKRMLGPKYGGGSNVGSKGKSSPQQRLASGRESQHNTSGIIDLKLGVYLPFGKVKQLTKLNIQSLHLNINGTGGGP
jgi:hypothetical protein